MQFEARGKLIPVNATLEKPKTKMGIDYRLFLGSFVVAALCFLLRQRLLAVALFGSVLIGGKLLTRRDPNLFYIWVLSFLQGTHYDPAKVRECRRK